MSRAHTPRLPCSDKRRRHGCYDDPNVWTAPRVHTLFGVDSSNRTQLRGLPLPAGGVDVIIDDASHAIAHQLVALEALWPRLIDGGFYIVEDLTIGALPWMRGAAGEDQVRRGPTNNTNCGHECQYVQRPSEHPFVKRLIPTIADQRAAKAALALGPGLPDAIERILDNNAWFFSITGAHVGGGLDSTVIIQKTEKGLDAAAIDELSDSAPPPLPRQRPQPAECLPPWRGWARLATCRRGRWAQRCTRASRREAACSCSRCCSWSAAS